MIRPVLTAEPLSLSSRVAQNRAKITDAAFLAGMKDDPYQHVMEGACEALGIIAAAAEAMEKARSPLSAADTKLLIAQTARQAATAIAGQLDAIVSAWRWRALAAAAAVVLLAMVVGGAGAWWFIAPPPPVWSELTCGDNADGSRMCYVFTRPATQTVLPQQQAKGKR